MVQAPTAEHIHQCKECHQFIFEKTYSEREKELTESKEQAYWERDQLVAYLSKLFPAHLSMHPEEDKNWEDDWRNIVCIHFPEGQGAWHIHSSELRNFNHLVLKPSDWDGHTTDEKYRRLDNLSKKEEK